MILISLDELMKFPIRINHYDKEHGSEQFVLGVEAVLDYAQNLTSVLLDEKTGEITHYPYTDERGYEWYNPDCYTDEVGGHHDSAIGWNPHGVWCGECTKSSCKGCCNEFVLPEEVEEDVLKQPAIEAEPIRCGEWLLLEGWFNKSIVKCSVCGNTLDMDGVNAGRGDANFCPNCGTDMREVSEDATD